MSTFNVVVPPHPLAPLLLRAINWAQPDDPEKKYPLLGRIRYVWTDEEKNVKILLKDGPNSWSEEQEEIMAQINGHETFISVVVLERDPVYIVATFKPVMETSYDRSIPMQELLDNLDDFNETSQSKGWPSILIDPFDLFDKAMEDMKGGKTTSRMDRLGEQIKTMLEQSSAEDQLGDMAKDAGIDGLEPQRIKIMTVDPVGNLEDKTEDFLKNGKVRGQDSE